MSQTSNLTIQLDKNLKEKLQKKAQIQYGLSLGELTNLFYRSIIMPAKITFYVDDKTFDQKFNDILKTPTIKQALKKLGKAV